MNIKLIYIENDRMFGAKKNIIYNGLLINPKIRLTENKDLCDYIFMNFRDFKKAQHYKPEYKKKLIVIDYRDNNNIFDIQCFKYFKRSVVNKNSLTFIKYNREIIPITYCLKNEVLEFKNIHDYDRYIDISIFFETNSKESVDTYRNLITNFIKKNFSNYNTHIGICGSKGKIGRNSIQKDYYEKMFHSKIIVTCNPAQWEGDYRTWEALSSGAMVMVDKMITPVTNPLIDEKHVIFYDINNLIELKKKILFYLKNQDLIKKIAKEGNNYALAFHKTSDRIDEILSHL